MELAIIAGVVAFLAGPTALRQIVRSARTLQQAKNDLTGPRALERLLLDDREDDEPSPPEE